MEIDTNQMKYDPSQHGRSISSFFLYQRIFLRICFRITFYGVHKCTTNDSHTCVIQYDDIVALCLMFRLTSVLATKNRSVTIWIRYVNSQNNIDEIT